MQPKEKRVDKFKHVEENSTTRLTKQPLPKKQKVDNKNSTEDFLIDQGIITRIIGQDAAVFQSQKR